MEAKDTVIDLTDMGNYSLKIAMTSILKQQAEITGKIMLEQGRKEVVKWVDDHPLVYSPSREDFSGIVGEWQAQKKLWLK